jgi:hypothetical protein
MALTLKIGRSPFPRSLQTQIQQRDRRESWEPNRIIVVTVGTKRS